MSRFFRLFPLLSLLVVGFFAVKSVAGMGNVAPRSSPKIPQTSPKSLPEFKNDPDDFFYAQQTSLWIFFKVPKEVIRRQIGDTLDRLGFEIASFEDKNFGYLIVKPMIFMAEFGFQNATIPGTSSSTEVEFTALVYPKNKLSKSLGSFNDFLREGAETSTAGQLRLDVLCDNEIAVAAGRSKFGEHKFLGSFEYSYPTANGNLKESPPFNLKLTASTWQGAGVESKIIFRIQADLKDIHPVSSKFSPELLYSAFPPEESAGIRQKAVGEFRRYDNTQFRAYVVGEQSKTEISYGNADGAVPLSPVPPFGDGVAIPGSERWPREMRDRMQSMLSLGTVAGYLLYKSPSAEYETRPFEVEK